VKGIQANGAFGSRVRGFVFVGVSVGVIVGVGVGVIVGVGVGGGG
jgi:hypothetical protein